MGIGRERRLVAKHPKSPASVPGAGKSLEPMLECGSKASIGGVAVRDEHVVRHSPPACHTPRPAFRPPDTWSARTIAAAYGRVDASVFARAFQSEQAYRLSHSCVGRVRSCRRS